MKSEIYNPSVVASPQMPLAPQNRADMPVNTEIVSEVGLRELRRKDLPFILEILRSNIVRVLPDNEAFEAQYGEMAHYFLKMNDSLLRKNDRQYTVATIQNQAIGVFGFMGVGQKTDAAVRKSGAYIPIEPQAELVNLYVHPDYQNKNVGGTLRAGSKLWNQVHDNIAKQGFQSISFLTTDIHSEMWPWYERQGYAQAGETEHFGRYARVYTQVINPQFPQIISPLG